MPGYLFVMKLHVCGLSLRRSSVLVTVFHLDIFQFVDLALEPALFAKPDYEPRNYPDNHQNQEGQPIREYAPFPRRDHR